ncbi:MAG: hypothetical protein KIT09_05245 [Bryobacteraceae bacterium]|nr:hypothetical protein [Bryobacteraceae bacterium]
MLGKLTRTSGALLAALGGLAAVQDLSAVGHVFPGESTNSGERVVARETAPSGITRLDWRMIRSESRQNIRAAFRAGGAYLARNPDKRFLTTFDGRGFSVEPDGAGWRWGLELESYGFAGHERAVKGAARVTAGNDRVSYAWDEILEEWFINDQRGLEHGFTLRARPPGDGARLSLRLVVRGGLLPIIQSGGRDVRFLDTEGRSVLRYAGLKVWDATGRLLAARLEPAGIGLRLAVDETGASYPITIDPIIDPISQQAYLKASNTRGGDPDNANGWFGAAVAVSGDTVVVGAPTESSGAKGVNGDQSDSSARTSGAAYVFVRSDGAWTQQAYLKASNTDAGDLFGSSVAISGDTIVVGAYGEASNAKGINGNQNDNSAPRAGAAYVFVRNGGAWSQQAYLKASNTDANDFFGIAVTLSGDTIVVGAAGEASGARAINGNQSDNGAVGAGAAYVFVRSGSTWSQQAYLKASNADPGDSFGSSVAISGETVVVGAAGEAGSGSGNQNDNSARAAGAAYVFVRSSGAWSQEAYLKADNASAECMFGKAVAVSDNTILVGAPQENAKFTGAAYVFARSGSAWSRQAHLKPTNTEAGDYSYFGSTVAVSGDTAIVGAPGAAAGAAKQNGSAALGTGAAYTYARVAGAWYQVAHLKASNGDVGDLFGASLAFSGDTIAVGAFAEAGNARGVGGDENDDSIPRAGAAYVFAFTRTQPGAPSAPDRAALSSQRSNALSVAGGMPQVTMSEGQANLTQYVITMADLLNEYKNYDFPPADGRIEIASLTPVQGVELDPAYVPPNKPLTIVFIEPRLLEEIPNSLYNVTQLKTRLIRFKQDLWSDGRYSLVLEANVDVGTGQQGRTLLAIRRFLKLVKAHYKLDGVIFVGRFPEAKLVHRFAWPREGTATDDCVGLGNRLAVTIYPGIMANRPDIPLADLDGNWESLYTQPNRAVEYICAVPQNMNADELKKKFKTPSFTITSRTKDNFIRGNVNYGDFFFLDDAQYTASVSGDTLTLSVTTAWRSAEVSASDLRNRSAIAIPDIYVSRINPRSAAFEYDFNFRDSTGKGLYDQFGKPRVLQGPAGPPLVFSADLERTLLVEYFDNNHMFRIGYFSQNRIFRPGAATNPEKENGQWIFPVEWFSTWVSKLRRDYTGGPVNAPRNATLADYAEWLKKSVALRFVMAHSSLFATMFEQSTAARLLQEMGPFHGWSPRPHGQEWAPEPPDRSNATFLFYRSLWKNRKLMFTSPSLMVHGGCNVNTPVRPTDPGQNAESILFYAKVLALMARDKLFYDYPEGQEYFRDNENAVFGDIWKRYSLAIAGDRDYLTGDLSARKRTYWWGILGDYTLRLRYPVRVPGAFSAVTERGNDPEIAVFGWSEGDYRGLNDILWYQGWRLHDLQPYVADNRLLYNAVWRKGTEQQMEEYSLSYSAFRSKYDRIWLDGWRLKILRVYVMGGEVRYAAVWRRGTDGEFQRYGATWTQLIKEHSEFLDKGYGLKSLQPYVLGGVARYIAVWHRTTERQFPLSGLTEAQFRAYQEALGNQWRIQLFEPYRLNGQVLYMVVWRRPTSPKAQAEFVDLTYPNFRAAYDAAYDTGTRLQLVRAQ